MSCQLRALYSLKIINPRLGVRMVGFEALYHTKRWMVFAGSTKISCFLSFFVSGAYPARLGWSLLFLCWWKIFQVMLGYTSTISSSAFCIRKFIMQKMQYQLLPKRQSLHFGTTLLAIKRVCIMYHHFKNMQANLFWPTDSFA